MRTTITIIHHDDPTTGDSNAYCVIIRDELSDDPSEMFETFEMWDDVVEHVRTLL